MARIVKTNGADAEATGGFVAYPDGKYIAQITDVKEVKCAKEGANAKMNALEVQFKIVESNTGRDSGKYTDFRVPDEAKFPSSDKVAFKFYQFYKALGVKFPEGDGEVELPDLDDLIGEEIGLELSTRQYNGKVQNETKGFFPASKGVGEAVSTPDNPNEDDEFSL